MPERSIALVAARPSGVAGRLPRLAPKILATALALLIAAVWLGPIAFMVLTSIKPNEDFLRGPFSLPTAPTLEPYRKVWEGLDFATLMGNSLLYSATGAALAVALALVPAYALSRFEVPGKKLIFGILLTGLMLPQQTVL